MACGLQKESKSLPADICKIKWVAVHLQFKGVYRVTMKNVDHFKTHLKIA